jgi:tetratricopeptide (TPR) repeat protein
VALHTFEQALALCRDVGWTDGTAHVLAHMGNAYFEVGDFAHCRTMNEQALRLSQAQGDTKAEAVYRDTIGLTYYFEGEPTLAQAQYERALALHEQMKDRRGKAYLLTHSGLALVALGEWDAAADRLHSARALRQPTVAEPVVVDTDAVLAWLAFCRGEVDSAEKQALAVAAAMTETGMAGIELPLLVAWHCFTILQAGGQSAAAGVLAQANARLTQVVQRIEDDALRWQFQAVPHHRQLAAAWAALSGSV